MNKKLTIIDKRETVAQSIIKDTFTTAMLGLMVYVSQDSTWWTFFTASMVILYLFARVIVIADREIKYAKTREEVIDYLDEIGLD